MCCEVADRKSLQLSCVSQIAAVLIRKVVILKESLLTGRSALSHVLGDNKRDRESPCLDGLDVLREWKGRRVCVCPSSFGW